MTGAFSVHSTPHYERLFRKLFRSVPDLPAIHTRVREILEADPYNRPELSGLTSEPGPPEPRP